MSTMAFGRFVDLRTFAWHDPRQGDGKCPNSACRCGLSLYPLTFLPAFNREAQGRRDNPVAYDMSEHGITLPCALNLTEDDLDTYCRGHPPPAWIPVIGV